MQIAQSPNLNMQNMQAMNGPMKGPQTKDPARMQMRAQRKAEFKSALQNPNPQALKDFLNKHPKMKARLTQRLMQPGGLQKMTERMGNKVGPDKAHQAVQKLAETLGVPQKPTQIT